MPFRSLIRRRRAVGLALGEGAARGLAHIGVLQVLHNAKIRIEYIAGTSAGALVGGLYAAGLSPEVMKRLVTRDRFKTLNKIFMPTFPHGGLFDGKRVSDFIGTIVGERTIEELKIPFAAVATDFITGDEVILRSGLLKEAIRASTCIPGVFSPPWLGDHLLCDGALVNPVPVDVVRKMGADIVIAVNLTPTLRLRDKKPVLNLQQMIRIENHKQSNRRDRLLNSFFEQFDKKNLFRSKIQRLFPQKSSEEREVPFGMLEALTHALSILYARNFYQRSAQNRPNFVLEPGVGSFSIMDFDKGEEIISAGEQCALEQIQMIVAQVT